MKLASLISLAFAATSIFAPDALADGRKPGSKLVYPVQRSGDGYFTIVCVTNANRVPATPNSFGGSTNLHFEYYNVTPNPANPFRPLGCVVFDRVEFLTPADTLSVLTSCHNATAGAQEGYLTITAQSPMAFDMDWAFDCLIGSEMVLNASGGVYAINAVPLAAANGTWTTTAAVQAPTVPIFHDYLPDVLLGDSFLALGGSQLALVSATAQPNYIRDVYFEVWNDNEFPLSSTLRFNCWFDQPLANVSPLFTESFLSSTAHAPDELDINCDGAGDLETGWFRITTRDISLPSGESLGVALGATIQQGMAGAITAGKTTSIDGGRLLWEAHRRP